MNTFLNVCYRHLRFLMLGLLLLLFATPDLLAQRRFPHRFTLNSRNADTVATLCPFTMLQHLDRKFR